MSIQVPCYGVFVVIIFFKKCIIKQLLDNFGFCDIHNNEGLGKCYQPQPSTKADNTYLYLDYSGYHRNLIQ